MSFIDVADKARNSILGSIDWASTFGNQLNENFVGQAEIPEALSQTRLNDANNRFSLASRLATWEDDLATSSAEAQFNNWNSNYRLQNFDDITRNETLQRDYEIMQSQANIDNFDSQQKLADVTNRQQIAEREMELETITFDREYQNLVNSIEGYNIMSPSQKYEAATDLANQNNVHPNVRARIEKSYLENSEEDLTNLRSIAAGYREIENLMALASQGIEVSDSLYGAALSRLSGHEAGVRDLEGSMRIGMELGLLTPEQVGRIRTYINNRDNLQTQTLSYSPQALAGRVPAPGSPSGLSEQNAPYQLSSTASAPSPSVPVAPSPGMDTGQIIQAGQTVQMPTPQPVPQQAQVQGNPAVDVASWESLAQTLPPCATEDSVNCVWRADSRGNGTGTSFIAIGDQNNPQIIRMPQPVQPQIVGDTILPPQPQVQQIEQFSVPYQESVIVDAALQNGRIVDTIESDVNFPRELVGVIGKTNYSPATWMQDRDNLIILSQQLELINDPTTKNVMRTILEAKLDSFVRMLQQNGINLNQG